MTKPVAQKRYWRIRGYDSTTLIFEKTVSIGQISKTQIPHLLRALAAKEGLTYREMVGAYATRGTRIANDHLEVHRERSHVHFWCGNNPHFDACIVDEDGEVLRPTLK